MVCADKLDATPVPKATRAGKLGPTVFSPEIRDELSVQGKWLGSSESQTAEPCSMYMVDHDIVLIADIATPTNWTRHRGAFANAI